MSISFRKQKAARLWLGAVAMALLGVMATTASAQTKGLQVGATYLCNGERVHISRCFRACEVEYPDRPLRNGFMVEDAEDISAITAKIQTCKQLNAGIPFTPPVTTGGGPGPGGGSGPGTGTTQGGGLSIIASMIGDVFGFFGSLLLWSVPLALIGWWGYNKYRTSRYFAIRKSNKE